MSLPVSKTGRPALEVARACGAEAKRLIAEGFGHADGSRFKGRGNIVTDTDLAVEKAVASILQAEFPEHAILSEESASTTRSEGWIWVVDPVDGTKNFAQGIPHIAFTIALCLENEPQLGLTVHPIAGWEFVAIKGKGATCNGEPMQVSRTGRITDSVFAVDMGYHAERGRRQLELALSLWPEMQSLRITGSAALGFAFVASGKWDIYIHSNLQPWDSAAGLLLVREAGGICSDRDGGPATIFSEGVVAANPSVHADFQQLAGSLPWR